MIKLNREERLFLDGRGNEQVEWIFLWRIRGTVSGDMGDHDTHIVHHEKVEILNSPEGSLLFKSKIIQRGKN